VKTQKSRLLPIVIVALLIIISIVLFIVHVKIITFPYQLELREGFVQLSTYAFLHGINPYSIPNNPVFINIYGILFNLFMLPFAVVFGNTLQLHRLINGILIFTQLIIIAKAMRTQRVGWLAIALATGFMWLGQLFGSTPLTRPDALGECLFLLTLLLPWICKFNVYSLILSIIFGIFSFQTKTYFFLSVIIIASYLFFFVSKQKAVLYTIAVVVLLALSIFILNHFFETYFVNTIYANSGGSLRLNIQKLFDQLNKFLRDYWGFFIFVFIFIENLRLELFNNFFRKTKIDLKHLNQPFFISSQFNFFAFCLVFTILFVIIILNNGTSQVYYYQLITPFLSMAIMMQIDRIKAYRNWLLLIAAITLLTQTYENLKPNFASYDVKDWFKLETRISNSKQILNSPLDMSILIEQDKPIAMSGQTQSFFIFPLKHLFLYPDPALMQKESERYINGIANKIKSKEYDFLETIENENYEKLLIGERLNKTQSNQNFISLYYHLSEILTIPMPQTNEVWKIGIWEPN